MIGLIVVVGQLALAFASSAFIWSLLLELVRPRAHPALEAALLKRRAAPKPTVRPAGAAHRAGATGPVDCGSGRLGDGTTTQRALPTAVSGGLFFAEISAGNEHTCGRSTAGSAICWGRNAEGQVGDGSTTVRTSPVGVKSP